MPTGLTVVIMVGIVFVRDFWKPSLYGVWFPFVLKESRGYCMNVNFQRKNTKFISVILSMAILFALSGCGSKNDAVPETSDKSQASVATQESVAETEPTRKLRNVETILVMGLDKYQAPQDAQGYLNDQQCDFLVLLILDRENNVCDMLHLNRDTMTKIQRIGVGGGAAGSINAQLALAHTYGSGGSDSCINTKKAVSNLLGGIKIDHYISMTMEAVAKVNDLAGGVTLEIMDDFSAVDPELVQGQTMTLTGDHALHYVRYRHGLPDSTNLHRMERQRQYMNALYEQIKKCIAKDDDFLSKTIAKVSSYLQSDYTINQMNALAKDLEKCTVNPFRTIDGEAVLGDEFMEFYVDEDSLQQVVSDLFYE